MTSPLKDAVSAIGLQLQEEKELKGTKGTSYFITVNFKDKEMPCDEGKTEVETMRNRVEAILGDANLVGRGKGMPNYWVGCVERGEQNQTPHWHIYVKYPDTNYKSWLQMKKMWEEYKPDIQHTRRKGPAAMLYVKKGGAWYECGQPPQQGRRSDIEEVHRAVLNGATKEELHREFPSQMIRMGKGIVDHMAALQKSYHGPREVWWWTGPPGAGKTENAVAALRKIVREKEHEKKPEQPLLTDKECDALIYFRSGNSMWFGGYNGQEYALFDEWRAARDKESGAISWEQLLSLTGNDPGATVQYKGGQVWWMAKYIMITSVQTWQMCVPFHEDDKAEQLSRRISKIITFTKPREQAVRKPVEVELPAWDPDAPVDYAALLNMLPEAAPAPPPPQDVNEPIVIDNAAATRRRRRPDNEEEEEEDPAAKRARYAAVGEDGNFAINVEDLIDEE